MKKVYTFNKGLFRKIGQMMAFALVLALTSATGFAQVNLNWTGAENNRFLNEKNWDPQGSPAGNDVTFPISKAIYNADSSIQGYEGNKPVLTGSENVSVRYYTVHNSTDHNAMNPLTVNLDPGVKFTATSSGNTVYRPGAIIVNSGDVHLDRAVRTENNDCFMEVNGGSLTWSSGNIQTTYGSSSTSNNVGVQFRVNGGKLILNSTGHLRAPYLRPGGFIIIKNDGVVTVRGSAGFPTQSAGTIPVQTLIDVHKSIHGGDDFYPVSSYDAVTNLTTIKAVPMSSVMFRESATKELQVGEVSPILQLVLTNRVRNAKSISWKYRKDGETTLTTFSGADSTAFAPSFSEGGTFFVVAEVVDEQDVVVKTNEVTYSVISDDISFSPAFDIQYIRAGEVGTEIKASFKGGKVPSAMEWKYAKEIGGQYVSFNPPQTSASIKPVFNVDSTETDIPYYVILEATIDGSVKKSPNIRYVVEKFSNLGRFITWTGLVSNNGNDPGNWSPVANSLRNHIIVPALSDSTKQYPVFNKVGYDTIQNLDTRTNSLMTIDMAESDTFNIRGADVYINGHLHIKNGIVSHRTSFFRIPVASGKVTLSNKSELWINNLLLGNSNTPNDGGSLHITDNAKVYNYFSTPGRISPDSAESVVYLSGNGTYWIINDVRSTVAGWIENGKVVAAQEGYKPYALYDAVSNYTFVKAINANGFMLSTDETQFTTVGSELEAPVGLVNVDGITSWEWKYSTSVLGPWESFSPAAKDVATFNPKFDKAGVYYLVAVDQNGNATGNMMEINVVSIDLLPAEPQTIERTANGTPISYVIPEGITLVKGTWWYTDVATGDVVDTQVADSTFTPKFDVIGVYDIFFYVEVNDVFGKQYFLKSNSVRITVTPRTGVENLAAGTLKLYPNPTTGLFHIDGGVKAYEVQVVDLAGQVITTERFTSGGRQPMMLNRKGVFIVKVATSEGIQIGRLIVR